MGKSTMKITKLAALFVLSSAMPAAFAQPPRPAEPKPCVLMPRQGSTLPPAPERPRGPCQMMAFPRAAPR
jgi:hypothetical protein